MKVNYIPMWENQDVLNYAKSELMKNELEAQKIVFNNYQIEDDLEDYNIKHFEIYVSEFYIDLDTTIDEFNTLIIENENLYKSYKTQRGLVNALIKSQHEVSEFEYNVMNII